MARQLYNLLLPLLALASAPLWLFKTWKRGGLSQRLWEKLAFYSNESPTPKPESIYIHAVSVGEANIALKLITAWLQEHPSQSFLLALGTSTGFDHASRIAPCNCQVLYAPLDLPFSIQAFLKRYQPSQIVLIEAEVWPNLIHYSSRNTIPLRLVNARLSERSFQRLKNFRFLLAPFYQKLSFVGAQTAQDLPRLQAIGIPHDAIQLTGSIKFDPALTTPSLPQFHPDDLLNTLGQGPLLMALSTHPGEEVLFAQAASEIEGVRIVIIPRHMERRHSIKNDLENAGFQVILRSQFDPKASFLNQKRTPILIVDSTGEMPAFTQKAHFAFIGKTLTAQGGQNPCEAIAAQVPILAGPHFQNFEPLATQLREEKAISIVSSKSELQTQLQSLLKNPKRARQQAQAACSLLEQHRGATAKTIRSLTSTLLQSPHS